MLQRFESGAGAESNLIWSSTSTLPRSLSTNLTVDLFGQSLNLLDAGLRMEGLEYLLETLLGPYGYFGDAKNVGTSWEKNFGIRNDFLLEFVKKLVLFS